MPIIHDLKLRSRPLDNGLLLTWDKLYNAHAYVLYRSGIKHLEVDSNQSVFVPDDSYTVRPKTWQNFEGDTYLDIYPNYEFSLTLDFQYTNALNQLEDFTTYIDGEYRTSGKIKYYQSLSEHVANDYVTKFNSNAKLEIISFTDSDYTLKFTPMVKCISHNANNSVITNIALPVSSESVS